MRSCNVLLQGAVPDKYRGRVFGTYSTTGVLLGLAGTVLAGQLGDQVPVVLVLNIQGFVYIVAGLLVLALLHGYRAAAPAHELRAADVA